MRPRPFALSAAMVAGTVTAGLALRLVPIGLPGPVVKHGGSILWALMVYAIASMIRPRWPPRGSAMLALVIAWSIECAQLYHDPVLDAVRRSQIGALLLGRVFSGWDLLAYAAAIMGGAAIDARIRPA
ncbi:DUF2809 domain-containing protein [Sphingomonas sp. A2-49]|uniref:ribosomal maturation YjgA family protein n=1 Tax=Sphingomonas sp. A2-49 TaxID=1391375 RepID=UPI0021D21A8B|nr:DUF2809 domain-containing protein [Sphingomonas sp. A2-49]MCU6454101.1 DUF2809 domain-containing protein [Sphingomonas sp. A2-49]